MKTTIGFLNKTHKETVYNKILKNLSITYYTSKAKEVIFNKSNEQTIFNALNDKKINFDIIK